MPDKGLAAGGGRKSAIKRVGGWSRSPEVRGQVLPCNDKIRRQRRHRSSKRRHGEREGDSPCFELLNHEPTGRQTAHGQKHTNHQQDAYPQNVGAYRISCPCRRSLRPSKALPSPSVDTTSEEGGTAVIRTTAGHDRLTRLAAVWCCCYYCAPVIAFRPLFLLW